MAASHHDRHGDRHQRRPRSRGVEPVYLSRAQRIHLARRLKTVFNRLRAAAADQWLTPDAARATEEEIRMVRSILGRLREARTDG
jgi:hypothetical protein